MRPLAAVAIGLAAALPACAQHGGGHASFGAHSAPAVHAAPAFHGSFAPATSFHYTGGPLVRPTTPYPSAMHMMPPSVRYPASVPINRPVFYQNNHGVAFSTTHHVYIRSYPYNYYPTAVYIPYGFYDSGYDDFDSGQQPAPAPEEYQPHDYGYAGPVPQPDYGYPQPMPEPGYAYPQPVEPGNAYPQPVPEYPPSYPQPQPQAYSYPAPPGYQGYAPAPPNPQMQYVPGSSDMVILIYKDGRPPEQIQNYLATRTTLTILDGGRRRVVPLDDLNIPATMRANRETGVDFKLPSVPGTTGCTGICAPSPENP